MLFWKQKSNLLFVAVLIVSVPVVLWLFRPGFFATDDGEWMIIRFSAFHQALVDGEFPVRWLGRLNHQYGYPVANFLYPGFMYLSEVPKALGFGFVESIKIIIGLSTVGSAIFTYCWLSKLFGKFACLVGALFYLYAPYHLYDLYGRGSVGELLALAVIPFVMWSIERKSFFWTAVGIAGLIISHNTLALLFLPIIIIYGFLRKLSTISYQLSTIIFGLALSAFFWLPAIFDLRYTRFFQTQVSNWQDYFIGFQLIGIASITVIIVTLYLRFVKGKQDVVSAMFIVFSSVSAFMAHSASSFIWQVFPASIIQFPFRFLAITMVGISFLASWYIDEIKGGRKIIIAGLFVLILSVEFLSLPYKSPQVFFDKGDSYYATNEDSTTVTDEYTPKWVKSLPIERPREKVEIMQGRGLVTDVVSKNNQITFISQMTDEGIIRVNTHYFPGWKAFIDGKEVSISYTNDRGAMDISAPKGKNNVRLVFGETPIRLAADGISLSSLIILVGFVLKTKIRKI